MSTLAWIFILASALVTRSVIKGRAANIAEDASDIFLAIVNGDNAKMAEVLARTGEGNTPSVAIAAPAGEAAGAAVAAVGNALSIAANAVRRGKAAKGYKWTATGPDYYDCSGLMWRACQDVGYKGPRFTTFDVAKRKGFKRISAPGAQGPGVVNAGINDLVVWPTHHMGVVTGPNKFYSARSVKSGIGETSINGFRKEAPIYLRYTG